MPCSYYNISICSRANGSSSVASSAYLSGERLFDERDNCYKNYLNKEEIIYKEVMLPENAPEEFIDREVLWNSVEHNERQYNSQLARKITAALPKEIPREDQIELVRGYCQENFVSKGMCADLAIHDKEDGNPHAHIMLTLRPLDEHGNWMPKSHKVYDLDENGEKIKLPSGYYASHKEKTTDWDEQSKAEEWRHSWEVYNNRYLEKNGIEERLDMRSYERQGVDRIPQIHMGPAVYWMEKRGIPTFIGDLNRSIQKMNEQLQQIKEVIEKLLSRVMDLKDQLIAAIKAETLPDLDNDPPVTVEDFLVRYMHDQQKDHGSDVPDKDKVMHSIEYLKEKSIVTISDLEKTLQKENSAMSALRHEMRENQSRINQIAKYRTIAETYNKYLPLNEQYNKIFFQRAKEKFYQEHKKELDTFRNARNTIVKLRNFYVDHKIPWNELNKESADLQQKNKELEKKIPAHKEIVQELKTVLDLVEKVRLKDVLRDTIQREREKPPVEAIPVREPERKVTIKKEHSYDMER